MVDLADQSGDRGLAYAGRPHQNYMRHKSSRREAYAVVGDKSVYKQRVSGSAFLFSAIPGVHFVKRSDLFFERLCNTLPALCLLQLF